MWITLIIGQNLLTKVMTQFKAMKQTWGGVCPRSSRSGLLSARGCSAGSS